MLQPAQFAAAFKGRRVARGALLMLHAALTAEAQAPRLGLVIGKRFAPRAVTRNAIKRVVRESFRHQRADLPAGHYVVRLHSRVGDLSLTLLKQQVRAEVDAHFARARRMLAAAPESRGSS